MSYADFDPLALLLILTGMAILPFAAMVVSAFTKVVVVLGLLRNALGVQQIPPNMVLNGVAIVISMYVMAPLVMDAQERFESSSMSADASGTDRVVAAARAAKQPFTEFLSKHAEPRQKAFFLKAASSVWTPERARTLQPDSLFVLAPAFLVTELTEAFRIGFLLFLAFIVVDLVVANILLAMGLSQVSPVNVAIPFKLLLFVALDGWSQLVHGLVMTYR